MLASSPKQSWGEGLGVTPHPAQALQLPAAPSPLLKVPAEQSRDGTTAVCHRGLGCQLGTEANRGVEWGEKMVPF